MGQCPHHTPEHPAADRHIYPNPETDGDVHSHTHGYRHCDGYGYKKFLPLAPALRFFCPKYGCDV
jgi:hypothetical protein